jgi:hypothetical protein
MVEAEKRKEKCKETVEGTPRPDQRRTLVKDHHDY